jgi:hypothetical protein
MTVPGAYTAASITLHVIRPRTASHNVKAEAQGECRPLVMPYRNPQGCQHNCEQQRIMCPHSSLLTYWLLHLRWCCEGTGYIVTLTKSIIVVNCNIFPCWYYFSSWVFTVYGCGCFRRFGGTCYLYFRWCAEFVGVGLVRLRVTLKVRYITEIQESGWFNT